MKSTKGFTLVELMVTLVVATTVLTLGVPAFMGIITSNKMTAITNALVGDLQYARYAAADGNTHVTVCASNIDMTGCSGMDWNNGWLVFEDNDQDDDLDAGERVLRRTEMKDFDRDKLVFDAASPQTFRFNTDGENAAEVASTLSFKIDADCDEAPARSITVGVIGNASGGATVCF